MHLLAYSGHNMAVPPKTLQAPGGMSPTKWRDEKLTISDKLEKCVSQHSYKIGSENHGVKEKNILFMILPLGYDVAQCDQVVLTSLEQFAKARGAVAHSSSLGTVTHFVDPKTEFDNVIQLIANIRPFDVEFDRLAKLAVK
jgi:hypothetical protein